LFLFFGFAVGADADDDRIELLLSSVKGKDITELIASGREKLASVPSGGGVAVSAGAAPAAGGAAPAAEAKKEEKVEEKEESDDVSDLFLCCYTFSWLVVFVLKLPVFTEGNVLLLSLLQDMGFSLFD